MDHMTAKVSCFARAYHHKHNEIHIFDDNAAGRLLGEDYAQIAKNMTEGLPFFFPDFEGTKEGVVLRAGDKDTIAEVRV